MTSPESKYSCPQPPHRHVSSGTNVSDFYSSDRLFESRPKHRLQSLTVSCDFPQPSPFMGLLTASLNKQQMNDLALQFSLIRRSYGGEACIPRSVQVITGIRSTLDQLKGVETPTSLRVISGSTQLYKHRATTESHTSMMATTVIVVETCQRSLTFKCFRFSATSSVRQINTLSARLLKLDEVVRAIYLTYNIARQVSHTRNSGPEQCSLVSQMGPAGDAVNVLPVSATQTQFPTPRVYTFRKLSHLSYISSIICNASISNNQIRQTV